MGKGAGLALGRLSTAGRRSACVQRCHAEDDGAPPPPQPQLREDQLLPQLCEDQLLPKLRPCGFCVCDWSEVTAEICVLVQPSFSKYLARLPSKRPVLSDSL